MKPGDKVKSAESSHHLSIKPPDGSPNFSKFAFLPICYLLISFEVVTELLFHKNGIEVLYYWLISGENILISLFAILPIFVFIAFATNLCKLIYSVIRGKLGYYIFIGDRLHEGSLVYEENDSNKNILFVSEAHSPYPSPYFNELYKKLIFLKTPFGAIRKIDNQNMISLMVQITIAVCALSFSFAGICIILKTYAYTQLPTGEKFALLSHSFNLKDFIPFLVEISSFLLLLLFSIPFFWIASFIWIKVKIRNFRNIQNDKNHAPSLPNHIKIGSILTGRILKSVEAENENFDDSIPGKRTIYLIEFTDGFDTPIYINYHLTEKNFSSEQPQLEKSKVKKILNDWKKEKTNVSFRIIADRKYQNLLTLEPIL
ncbi:hypothetical protein LEP1GSC039_1302 [Leptospira santarosai str. 2000027870]|uniref:hypothetical protein n=1 Tax=Leptospira santarosai TaxID=28183 RepID=UPI0002BDC90C|nr:hypothetical protein LEP1GSC039_1302 [Leptospira santarosai str. 2000027870]